MALVSAFSKYEHQNPRVHGEVECGYTIFERDGRRYLQLDTYGSPDRKIPGKTSQTIQFDSDSALLLQRILSETFGSS